MYFSHVFPTDTRKNRIAIFRDSPISLCNLSTCTCCILYLQVQDHHVNEFTEIHPSYIFNRNVSLNFDLMQTIFFNIHIDSSTNITKCIGFIKLFNDGWGGAGGLTQLFMFISRRWLSWLGKWLFWGFFLISGRKFVLTC